LAEPRRLRANLLLLLAALIWGLAFVAQRMGAAFVGPSTFNAVRFAMGAAVLLVVIVVLDRRRGLSPERRREATRAVLLPGGVCGALLALAAGLQQAALGLTTAGNTAFVTGLYIVLVPLFGVVVGQRIGWRTLAALVPAVAGLYLIAVTDQFTIERGDLLALAGAGMFAVQILVVDHYAGKLSALRFSAVQFASCALVSAVAAFFTDEVPFGGIDLAIIPLLYGGVMSVGIAYTLQVVGQRDALPAHAALIMALEAVFGALGGAVILGENMGFRGYSGAALMVVGIVISQLGANAGSKQEVGGG
jgi:drug/metabolite transporter (DMT)-like permease